MSTNPRFQVGDIVEFDAPADYSGGAPREPFAIQSLPMKRGKIYRYHYQGWEYPETCLRLVEATASGSVDVDIGELL